MLCGILECLPHGAADLVILPHWRLSIAALLEFVIDGLVDGAQLVLRLISETHLGKFIYGDLRHHEVVAWVRCEFIVHVVIVVEVRCVVVSPTTSGHVVHLELPLCLLEQVGDGEELGQRAVSNHLQVVKLPLILGAIRQEFLTPKACPGRLGELVGAASVVTTVLNEATLLPIVIRSVVSHVLVHDTDGVEAPLARGLRLAAPIHRGVVLRWFLHEQFGMLPVQKAFVIHAFIDPEYHLWFLRHSSKNAIKEELFRVVILIAEIQNVASLLVLGLIMYRLVNGRVLHGLIGGIFVYSFRIEGLLHDLIVGVNRQAVLVMI